MEDETPRMAALTQEMRTVMAAWIKEPNNESLKRRYRMLQQQYQRQFLEYKRAQAEGATA